MMKFGIVGTGAMAASMMEAFKLLPQAKVVAVASLSSARSQAFSARFNIAKAYDSLSSLLNDDEIDAIYIANATEHHATSTIQALNAGKSVLCEKPIATSEADCQLVATAAANSGKLCMEAMWTHFLPAYQRLFALQHHQNLGKALHLYADFGYPANALTHPRLFSSTPGSGVLLDRGVYPIALAIKIFGRVRQCSSQVMRNENGVDTHANILLHHENGGYSQLATSIDTLLQNRAALAYTQGLVSIEPPLLGAERISIEYCAAQAMPLANDQHLKDRLKNQLKQSPMLRRLKNTFSKQQEEYHSYGSNQYLPMLKHFCQLHEAGNQESTVIPLSLSTEVLRVVDDAKSLKSTIQ